jgi:hypothetical protein
MLSYQYLYKQLLFLNFHLLILPQEANKPNCPQANRRKLHTTQSRTLPAMCRSSFSSQSLVESFWKGRCAFQSHFHLFP